MTLTLLEIIGVVGLFGGGVGFLWWVAEGMRTENRTAHDGITKRIDDLAKKVDPIVVDVAWLRGRQAERDKRS